MWQSTGVSVDSQFNYEYEETPTEIYLTDWKAFAPPNWTGKCRGENWDDSEYYCLLSTSSSRFAVIHIEKCPASRATKSSSSPRGSRVVNFSHMHMCQRAKFVASRYSSANRSRRRFSSYRPANPCAERAQWHRQAAHSAIPRRTSGR